MNDSPVVQVIVEGQTEDKFIREVLAPHLWPRNVFLKSVLISKRGQKGGDVKFSRAEKDIYLFLREKNVTIISTFFDFYGINESFAAGSSTKVMSLPMPLRNPFLPCPEADAAAQAS